MPERADHSPGRSFKHVHELNELWTAARARASPSRRHGTDAVMKRLAEYAETGDTRRRTPTPTGRCLPTAKS